MQSALTGRILVAGVLVALLAGCSADADPVDPSSQVGNTPQAQDGDDESSITVDPRPADDSDEQVEVNGVLIDVPAGLEVRETDDGVSEKIGLHEAGRERAVLVLSVTQEDAGVTDADVDDSRLVFRHNLVSAGLAEDPTLRDVEWSAFEYALGVELDLQVDDQEYPVTWVVGRDGDGTRLVTVYVEADEGEDLTSTPAYDALRTIRFE